tara:strand:- start:12451 stop:12678 length:228 start_codon:yes stop_codon:yes gene_type:complete
MDAGIQPLDALLTKLELSSHDLVAASTEQITHKMVTKGRKGRKLTANLQGKITRALSAAANQQFEPGELFNYDGR